MLTLMLIGGLFGLIGSSRVRYYNGQPYVDVQYNESGVPFVDSAPLEWHNHGELRASGESLIVVRTGANVGRLFMYSTDELWNDYCEGQEPISAVILENHPVEEWSDSRWDRWSLLYGSISANERASRLNRYFALRPQGNYILSVNGTEGRAIRQALLEPTFGITYSVQDRFYNCTLNTIRSANLPNLIVDFRDPRSNASTGQLVIYPEDYFGFNSWNVSVTSDMGINETMLVEVCDARFWSTHQDDDTFEYFFNPLLVRDINVKLTFDSMELCDASYPSTENP